MSSDGLITANRESIGCINDLTDREVVAVCQKLEADSLLTKTLGVAWAISMVTDRPVLLDNEESAPLLHARYQKLLGID